MKSNKLSLAVCSLLLSTSCTLNATTLKEAVENTLNQNPQLRSIVEKNKAYKLYIDEEKGTYLPTLDLKVNGGVKETKITPENSQEVKTNQDGSNTQIVLEQLIYDGGLTPAKIEEAKLRSQVNELTNTAQAESVIFSTVKAYLDLAKYKERLNLSEMNIATHEKHLITAKSNEEFTGNTLDTYEVKSKLYLAKKNMIEELDNQQIAKNSFKRLTGIEINDEVCAPNIDESVLPTDITDLVNYAIKNNSTVLAQVAKISEQRAIINQEKSKYLPTLTFNLQKTWDQDLITANADQNNYTAQLVLNYNLYNGGKDSTSNEREKLFLKESQEILNSKTDLVVDEVTSAYNTFKITKDKIKELENYVTANENILMIYKEQFEGGTRTFVDILDVESDLYDAKVQLIDEQVKLLEVYYTILTNTSQIQDVVMNQTEQTCVNILPKPAKAPAVNDNELKDLNNTLNVNDVKKKTKVTGENIPFTSLSEILHLNFEDEINNKSLEFDKNKLSFRMTTPESSMPIGKDGKLVFSDNYKKELNDFSRKLIEVIKSRQDEIAEVQVVGHSSSNFIKSKNTQEKYNKNLILSQKRADTVLEHVKSVNPNQQESLKIFKSYGKSYDEPVINSDGTENIEMSKRVEFIIKER